MLVWSLAWSFATPWIEARELFTEPYFPHLLNEIMVPVSRNSCQVSKLVEAILDFSLI